MIGILIFRAGDAPDLSREIVRPGRAESDTRSRSDGAALSHLGDADLAARLVDQRHVRKRAADIDPNPPAMPLPNIF